VLGKELAVRAKVVSKLSRGKGAPSNGIHA
jgi:hypothetical protein